MTKIKEMTHKLIGYRRFIEKMAMTIPGYIFDAEPFDMAISAMEKQEQDGWIPCSVRLPKEKDAGILKKLGTDKRSDYVLATVEVKGERMTVTACTYDGKWDWNMKYAFPDYKVIAWQPLPEPYTEEES